jgi:hypothetical protein
MMAVEDKEGMALGKGGCRSLSPFISRTNLHTTAPHGWTRLGFIQIFSSFLLLSVAEREEDPTL